MKKYSSKWIRPLCEAENSFLEILLTRFFLQRQGQSTKLHVRFDDSVPAIWRRYGKYSVKSNIPDFERKAANYQHTLDQLLLESTREKLNFNDEEFPFRYASGGALPILRIGEKEYYCLFYREIPPIGWNIANGGTDSMEELLNPLDTVERELSEELIVYDLKDRKRYFFERAGGRPLDLPEFALARRLWEKRLRGRGFTQFEEAVMPIKWLDGSDSVVIKAANERRREIDGCFLNINALDFGIEIDRIAMIHLDGNVVLCDGEIVDNHLLDQPVGLFEVDRFNNLVLKGKTEFLPDYFFWNATQYEGKDFKQVVANKFLPSLRKVRTAPEKQNYKSCENKFDLCPVTRRITRRYLSLQTTKPKPASGPFEVFISYAGEDAQYAKRIHDFLTTRNIKSFFNKETTHHPHILRVVNDALDTAECLVGVATRPEYLYKEWVKFEWESFFMDILSSRKPNAKLVPFISGFHPADLPRPFRLYDSIIWEHKNMGPFLQKLEKYIRYPVGNLQTF